MDENKYPYSPIISGEKYLIDMTLHPTPLQKVDPLSLETVIKKEIKEEVDDIQYNGIAHPHIIIKEEIDLKEEYDANDEQETTPDTVNQDDEVSDQMASHNSLEQFNKNQSNLDVQHTEEGVCNKLKPSIPQKRYKCPKSRFRDYEELNIIFCKYCQAPFTGSGQLERHKETHFPHQYKCKYCDKHYKSLANLEKHEEIHIVKEYKCKLCGMTFKRRADLVNHDSVFAAKNLKYLVTTIPDIKNCDLTSFKTHDTSMKKESKVYSYKSSASKRYRRAQERRTLKNCIGSAEFTIHMKSYLIKNYQPKKMMYSDLDYLI